MRLQPDVLNGDIFKKNNTNYSDCTVELKTCILSRLFAISDVEGLSKMKRALQRVTNWNVVNKLHREERKGEE